MQISTSIKLTFRGILITSIQAVVFDVFVEYFDFVFAPRAFSPLDALLTKDLFVSRVQSPKLTNVLGRIHLIVKRNDMKVRNKLKMTRVEAKVK